MKQQQTTLKKWYKAAQGKVAGRCIAIRLEALWPNIKNTEILVIGAKDLPFATFLGARVTYISGQRAAENLPYADKAFDYIFIAHTLEFLQDDEALLTDCARCLVPAGKLLIMVTNRLSAWARAAETPFGVGQPYSSAQVKTTLIAAELMLGREEAAIFYPPLKWGWILRSAPKFESFGRVLRPWARACGMVGGGVLLIEGVKQVVGGTPVKMKKAQKPSVRLQPAFNKVQHK